MSTATQTNILLRLFPEENIILGPTDDAETLWEATKVFAHRDRNLLNWDLNETSSPGRPTRETPIAFYEVVENATFLEMFGKLGDLKGLCFQQSQITAIARDHQNKLQSKGFSTFALFTKKGEKAKKDGSNVFVAGLVVHEEGRKKGVHIYEFSYNYPWRAKCAHRIVSPLVT